MKLKHELLRDLDQFTGTEMYHKHSIGGQYVLLTDGAAYLAEHARCYWLMDIIVSVLDKLREDWFADVTLTVDVVVRTARVEITDGSGEGAAIYEQAIEYTDFPLESIQLYVCDTEWDGGVKKVVMLPSEY